MKPIIRLDTCAKANAITELRNLIYDYGSGCHSAIFDSFYTTMKILNVDGNEIIEILSNFEHSDRSGFVTELILCIKSQEGY